MHLFALSAQMLLSYPKEYFSLASPSAAVKGSSSSHFTDFSSGGFAPCACIFPRCGFAAAILYLLAPAEFQEELVIVKLVARIITTDTTAAVLDALSFILF
jgi:hypothetical protein